MSNVRRIDTIASRTPPKHKVGERIRCRQGHGIIQTTYVDFEAVLDSSFAVPDNWYELQNIQPKTPKTKAWHSVILTEGAVLVGDDDIEEGT